LTGYVAILVGAALTFIMQSSSVFTSALTPLVGIGVLRLDVMYPLTLGANVGTTGTAILAAFAVDAKKFKSALQIALCHLFFNLSGILIFYPLPFMRWPIYFAKKLGKTTAKYRWVALLYILSAFLLLPGLLLALSFASEIAVIVVVAVLILLLALLAILNFLQETHPTFLPKRLQNWNYLPLPLRSFQPYDSFFLKCSCYRKLQVKTNKENLSRKTSHVTVPTKSLTIVTQPSNISLSSFPIGTEATTV
jgi:sodium-dependent phosphate cotransporter